MRKYVQVDVEIDMKKEFYNLSPSEQKEVIEYRGGWSDFFDPSDVLNDFGTDELLERLSDDDLKIALAKRSLLWRELE